MSGRMTTQQFLIRDIPEHIAGAVPRVDADAAQVRAEQYRLREQYTALIESFSASDERNNEEATFAHRRYAKMMVVDGGYHLRTALSLLRQGQQLTGAEVAAIVAGAERGAAITGAVRLLIDNPQQLPEATVADAIRAHVLASRSPRFEELRKALRH